MSDRAYLTRVRTLPCCACGTSRMVEAHHRTDAGLALKASDYATMPLCSACHREFHDSRGVFRAWDRQLKQAWQDAMIEWTQRRLNAGVQEVANG